MISEVLIALVGVLVVGLAGGALTLRSVRRTATAAPASPLAVRWRRTREHLVEDLGPVPAGLLVGAAGTGVTIAIGWPLGLLAASLQPSVDVPVFDWFRTRLGPDVFSSVQDVLTQMGNRPQIKVVALVAAVVLAIVWRRRWWVPVLVIVAAFVIEKYVQAGLGKVVARGHPPTTLGTYPSGGCARLISMYGSILYLCLRRWQAVPWVRGVLWTLLAEAAWLEGFARTYRLQHWVTDVVGGWIVGCLLLATFVATTSMLVAPRASVRAGSREPAAVDAASVG